MLALKTPSGKRVVREDLPLLAAIISGGQTGSDQAGLRAAYILGLATGGHAPKGWRTLAGAAPWLGTEFGLIEHESSNYANRTASNVINSDATVRIASDFSSPGERCTLKAIEKYNKPYLNITVGRFEDGLLVVQAYDSQRKVCGGLGDNVEKMLVRFLVEHSVKILNVAGNSNTTCAGIDEIAERFLLMTLSRRQ